MALANVRLRRTPYIYVCQIPDLEPAESVGQID